MPAARRTWIPALDFLAGSLSARALSNVGGAPDGLLVECTAYRLGGGGKGVPECLHTGILGPADKERMRVRQLLGVGLAGLLAAGWTSGAETNAVARPTGATNRVEDAAVAVASETDQRAGVYDDVAVLTEVLLLVRRHYVEERSYREIVAGAIHGLVESLDPHSAFLEPDAFEDIKEETEGLFGGIGIHVGLRDGWPLVIAPIEDSPAYRAGLLSGDRLIAVEGQTTAGFSIDKAMKALRGAAGTAVTVTVAREGEDPFDVRIVRDEIKLVTVKGPRLLRGKIGYIRVAQFSEPTAAAFADALDRALAQKVDGLVLDLRDNPGGLLNVAVALVERFLPAGVPVVTVRGREGTRQEVPYRAGSTRRLTDLPLAVLVNRGSASASEIVAGALQDHRRAVIVGEKTYGKASVQNVVRLTTRPDYAIKLTTAHYYTPNGRLIHGRGIEPDIVAPLPPRVWRRVQLQRSYEEMPEAFPEKARENTEGAVDIQLERALDVLVGLRALAPAR